jgi:DNA-binding GntR family transcriptional regulator
MDMQDTLRIDTPPITLRLMAVERLRAAIIAGHFTSGTRLIERTLCDQLGVSRSVVREAIRYLEAEGLVEITPRVGPIVARLDWTGAAQIYAIRRLLESAAAADCARRADENTRYALQVALHHLEAVVCGGDAQSIYRSTTRFYEIIFQSAGHHIAWEIVQRLNGRISRLRAITLATTDRKVAGPVHMARICAAISAGNAAAAAHAVEEHLTDAAEIARHLLQAETEK